MYLLIGELSSILKCFVFVHITTLFSNLNDNKSNIDENQQNRKFKYLAFDDQVSNDTSKIIFNNAN